MAMPAWFMTVKTWKQPRCPSVDDWINKLGHSGNGILFGTKKEVSLKPRKDMDELKCILLSEGSQAEKVTCCMILKVRHSGKSKTLKTVKRSVVARGSGEEQMNGWNTEDFQGS